jgi:hypothetical protein
MQFWTKVLFSIFECRFADKTTEKVRELLLGKMNNELNALF